MLGAVGAGPARHGAAGGVGPRAAVPHGAAAPGEHRRASAGAAGGGLRPVAPMQPDAVRPDAPPGAVRAAAADGGAAIEPQDIPLPLRWGRLPPEALLLAAGAWLLAEGRLPD